MPTSNIQVNLPVEQSELAQIDAIAKELGLDRTTFIRLAVRKEISALGHVPSNYEYKSGIRKKAKGQ